MYLCRRNEGYILFDFILALFLVGSTYITVLSLFNVEIKKCASINIKILQKKEDDFILDYLEKEMLASNYIIKTEEIKDFNLYFPKNLNYIMVKRLNNNFRYTTYVIENNKLKRLSIQGNKLPSPNYFKKYGGNNILSYNLESLEIDVCKSHTILRIKSKGNEIKEKFINLSGRDYEV